MSARRRTIIHGSIQRRNIRRLKSNTRINLAIKLRDDLITASRTDSSNISLNTKVKRKT